MRFLGRFRGPDPKAIATSKPAETPANGDSQGPQDLPSLPKELLWLLDAPMFIDQKQVEAFYDAILLPEVEGTGLTISDSLARGRTFSTGITVGAAVPGLAKGEVAAGVDARKDETKSHALTFQRIVNPYRHLLKLAIHYATEKELRKRIVFVKSSRAVDARGEDVRAKWAGDEYSQASPRAMVMLELPAGVPLVPMALETEDGTIKLLFQDLVELWKEPGEVLPAYPEDPSLKEQRRKHWRWFTDRYKHRDAMEILEAAARTSRIAWIDFRLPIGTDDPSQAEVFLHLHIAARCEYETGVFAYNFIGRGFKHGLRIVGTLKSEPDLNVLAVFER
jgi:hypothetical protein